MRLGPEPSSLSLLVVAALLFSQPGVVAQPSVASRAENLLRQGKTQEALPLLLQLHQSQPDNWKICHQVALAYTQLQQLEKAHEFYRKTLKFNPGFLPARKNLATVLWFLGRKQESEREFLSVAKLRQDDPVPHLYLGLAQYERKSFVKAKEHFAKAGELAFDNPEVLPVVVETYLATKDVSLPVRRMDRLVRDENPDPELCFQLGNLFGRYQMYDQAARAFGKVRDTYANRYAVLFNLGLAQLRGGQFSEAIDSFGQIVALNLTKPEVYLMLGEAYDKQGMPEKAYESYGKAIELDPGSEQSYIALANFASAHRNNGFALKVVAQGLRRMPGSAKLLLQQGLIYALQGGLDEAEDSFLKASQADPEWPVPLLAGGILQLEKGELSRAAATFRRAARVDPRDSRAQYLYATAVMRMGDPGRQEEVISALEKAITLGSDDPRPRVSLGQAYLAAGRLEEAVAQLEAALKIDPEHSPALYRLGLAYRRQGKTEPSQRLLQKFEEVKAKQREQESSLVQILKIVTDR